MMRKAPQASLRNTIRMPQQVTSLSWAIAVTAWAHQRAAFPIVGGMELPSVVTFKERGYDPPGRSGRGGSDALRAENDEHHRQGEECPGGHKGQHKIIAEDGSNEYPPQYEQRTRDTLHDHDDNSAWINSCVSLNRPPAKVLSRIFSEAQC